MNNQFTNPFEGIINQMNQAKAVYEQTMGSLQGQLHQARQAMNAFQPFNSGMNTQGAQSAQTTNILPAQSTTTTSPVQEVPTGVQQITILGEIKAAIEKSNESQNKLVELFGTFINGVPVNKPETNITQPEKIISKKAENK